VDVVRSKIGAVQQGAGDAADPPGVGLVAADHGMGAGALPDRVAVPAARTGVHRANQHKRPTNDPSRYRSF
jgi:hypothetical protein